MVARSVQRERKSRVMTLYSPRTSAAISMSTYVHIFEFQTVDFSSIVQHNTIKLVFSTENWNILQSKWDLQQCLRTLMCICRFQIHWSSAEPVITKTEGIPDTHPSTWSRLFPQTRWMEKEENPGGGRQDTYFKGFNSEVRGCKIDISRSRLCNCSQI